MRCIFQMAELKIEKQCFRINCRLEILANVSLIGRKFFPRGESLEIRLRFCIPEFRAILFSYFLGLLLSFLFAGLSQSLRWYPWCNNGQFSQKFLFFVDKSKQQNFRLKCVTIQAAKIKKSFHKFECRQMQIFCLRWNLHFFEKLFVFIS